MPQPERPNYLSQSRNGYGAIDFYRGDRCIENVVSGITQKLADELVGKLNNAIEEGRQYETLFSAWERSQS